MIIPLDLKKYLKHIDNKINILIVLYMIQWFLFCFVIWVIFI